MSIRKIIRTTYYLEQDGQKFEVLFEPVEGTEIICIKEDRAVVGYLSHDEDAENSRVIEDPLGVIVIWHRWYDLGDMKIKCYPTTWLRELAGFTESAMMEEVWEVLDKKYVFLPISLLEHSGLHIWVDKGAHACDPGGWDSGQVGWIYCSLQKAVKEFDLPEGTTWKTQLDNWAELGETISLQEATERVLEEEVKEYDRYLRGEVFGVCISTYSKTDNGWELQDQDECWGYIGRAYAYQRLEADIQGRIK